MLLDPNDSRRCMQPLALSFLNKVERCKKKGYNLHEEHPMVFS